MNQITVRFYSVLLLGILSILLNATTAAFYLFTEHHDSKVFRMLSLSFYFLEIIISLLSCFFNFMIVSFDRSFAFSTVFVNSDVAFLDRGMTVLFTSFYFMIVIIMTFKFRYDYTLLKTPRSGNARQLHDMQATWICILFFFVGSIVYVFFVFIAFRNQDITARFNATIIERYNINYPGKTTLGVSYYDLITSTWDWESYLFMVIFLCVPFVCFLIIINSIIGLTKEMTLIGFPIFDSRIGFARLRLTLAQFLVQVVFVYLPLFVFTIFCPLTGISFGRLEFFLPLLTLVSTLLHPIATLCCKERLRLTMFIYIWKKTKHLYNFIRCRTTKVFTISGSAVRERDAT